MPDNTERYFKIVKTRIGYQVIDAYTENVIQFKYLGASGGEVHVFGSAKLAKKAVAQSYPKSFIVRGSNPLPLISSAAFQALATDPTLTSMAEYGAAGEFVSRAKGMLKGKRKKRNALITPSMVGKFIGGRMSSTKTINPDYSSPYYDLPNGSQRDGWNRAISHFGSYGRISKVDLDINKRIAKMSIEEYQEHYNAPYKSTAEDQIEQAKGYLRGANWAKTHLGKRRNPSDSDLESAEDVSREWHGREPQEVIEIDEEEVYEDVGAILADLEELGVLADEDGKLETWAIRFKRDRPKLTSDLKMENLEIVGGDQELEIEENGKVDMPLGYCYQIVYETDKHHLEGSGGYPESYEHFFGEEFYKKEGFDQDDFKTSDDYFEELLEEGVVLKAISKGYLPMVVYNVPNCKIRLVGGKYKIKDVGIED